MGKLVSEAVNWYFCRRILNSTQNLYFGLSLQITVNKQTTLQAAIGLWNGKLFWMVSNSHPGVTDFGFNICCDDGPTESPDEQSDDNDELSIVGLPFEHGLPSDLSSRPCGEVTPPTTSEGPGTMGAARELTELNIVRGAKELLGPPDDMGNMGLSFGTELSTPYI